MSTPSTQLEAQLKAKLWCVVEAQLRSDLPRNTVCTPSFVNALVELCYVQLVEMGRDLEAFAHHASRNVITEDDLALLLRKTPDLLALLEQ
ncbi:hypothetical protein TBLA_0F01140 [Henningerozyma blattae CBS 6284]|uniref:MHF histone-fold complex subunit 1 n=1 Tax=Henningerozyma blattae (strain ATCC 34711 / CBS 6284 / DSM 70876 / NBRC 10599 / NRRL Y-10934 / UCD 77-7) TaxID=1071380 RepID=I2H5K5_HENB6|nr:hypothetical protein TBLA_0F01140 [Tetrapisispora blattae CBS 6284]CCH61657.1 hypothetical protein TBLA_0F01140 [Tetrapisispora blattae CBS 6284]